MVKDRIEEFKRKARETGLKVTPQRLAVYREIVSRHDHPSAEELYENLKEKIEGISLTTVYRTLASLEKAGLVQRVPTLKDKVRYDAKVEPHSHFICVKCGRIFDLEIVPEVDRSKIEVVGEPLNCTLMCYGICRECKVEGT
ncbi:Fur family peroxide stress response transcriptional regulator [Thermovibrio guaymasensis]|uniref:Fur family peroxide stress response transcriptional regulator n=1 Tax=Thermovibrio guaymasensis TaxID=240167 RepID=A0A420W7P2_9BACT|nr:Fur family transcriptional regulator [Thermovibrio guaymasensis]RKQ63323.1 Fur family peroxide stress response transcriptional regulator [Thermovibrio guaymasensis]